MSILVVCPGCRKSFKVSDKYAGKSGGCPNCKTVIQVPAKDEEVQVHAPTEFAEGGRSTTGKLVTKPVAWEGARLSPVLAVAVAAGTLTALLVAWLGGRAGLFVHQVEGAQQPSLISCAIGLLLVTPPLVLGAYSFLRDDELEPYQGRSLQIRLAICSLSYVGLWGVFGYVTGTALSGDPWQWLFVLPPFLIAGALIALASLDLQFGSAFFLYVFYVSTTALLGWIAGIGWLGETAIAWAS
jgi:hypothetical protein